ncbi:MAG: bifunctional anthranilate synthase component I family protein/class IV aminotransferase [Actinobacteria bacterium]|nr:bifunctional anthranilate synthase component I family protein/class IV aminotransferase [Actinomycetota bacterium]
MTYAAFDLALDPRDRTARLRGAFTQPPVTVLRTSQIADVPAVVTAAEAAAAAGHWVVGGLAYEAGGAWDASQRTHPGTGDLARFEVFFGEPEEWPAARPPADPAWFPSGGFHAAGPAAAIEAVQRHIAAGDCYQVNLTSRLRTIVGEDFDLYAWFRALATRQPGGYAVFLRDAGVASVSPELFFHAHPDGRVVTQPMKGTAEAATPPERLWESPKERAENLMIVDLLRNDLGRICRPGTIRVDALFDLLELPTVWQLVSTVSGERMPGTGLNDLFAALFPCGSVTGAPKIRSMQVIAGLEAQPRGWYCGALGVIRPGGEAIFNVAIRTVEQQGRRLDYGLGSGVVADSEPSAELAEWRAKAGLLGGEPLAALETLLLQADDSVPGAGFVQRFRYPHLDAHLRRLARTDAALGLGIDPEQVTETLERARHGAGASRGEDGPAVAVWRVRLTARAGSVQAKTTPAGDFPQPLPLALAEEPIDVAALRPVIAHKTTWRAHYEALRERRPADAFDVICHTPDGLVTEATLGNLAFHLDGRWVTPPARLGLLPGIEREARLADGTLAEAEVQVSELARVSEFAFLKETLINARPSRSPGSVLLLPIAGLAR